MHRRDLLRYSTASLAGLCLAGRPLRAHVIGRAHLPRDSHGVAFVISPGANVIDLAGAWEVFQDVMVGAGAEHRHPFHLYTVSDRPDPIEATGGLTIVPDFTLAEAPAPDIISVGAQRGSDEIHAWLRDQHERSGALIMSVCTGAFQLAGAGILDGRRATTHHDFWESFEERYPEVTLVRGRRFVDDGDIVTAGGLTSGIDAALHVVARLFGTEAAARTADYMEYDSEGWRSGARASTR